jgi:glycogen debranching enzyme
LLYSGDREFLKEVYPVVKRAINGAIRFRIDENFYLTHQDNETWMHQSFKGVPLSPRGNRAVEIQSLWYTALMIGSKLASWNQEAHLQEHWLTIAQSLRDNFIANFWKPFRSRMYDHLKKSGTPESSLRPNILFTASLPNMFGIPSLVNDNIKARVTHTVLNKLTFRYGTSTLWQKDRNFISGPVNSLGNSEYRSRYDGAVWHWLAGPLIKNLLYLGRDEIAYYLYSYESNQILYENAIGSFAAFRDAHPLSYNKSHLLKRNLCSSRSLAEFTRNFYEDFVGYRPNAIEEKILLTPVFPIELKYVSTKLPYAQGWIYFKYLIEDNLYSFELSKENIAGEITIEFKYPGYDARIIRINDRESSISFNLDPAVQRSYSRYDELEWHFAQWDE